MKTREEIVDRLLQDGLNETVMLACRFYQEADGLKDIPASQMSKILGLFETITSWRTLLEEIGKFIPKTVEEADMPSRLGVFVRLLLDYLANLPDREIDGASLRESVIEKLSADLELANFYLQGTASWQERDEKMRLTLGRHFFRSLYSLHRGRDLLQEVTGNGKLFGQGNCHADI